MMRTCQRRVDFYYLRDSLPACQGEHQGGMLPSAADYLQAQGIVRHCGYHAVQLPYKLACLGKVVEQTQQCVHRV